MSVVSNSWITFWMTSASLQILLLRKFHPEIRLRLRKRNKIASSLSASVSRYSLFYTFGQKKKKKGSRQCEKRKSTSRFVSSSIIILPWIYDKDWTKTLAAAVGASVVTRIGLLNVGLQIFIIIDVYGGAALAVVVLVLDKDFEVFGLQTNAQHMSRIASVALHLLIGKLAATCLNVVGRGYFAILPGDASWQKLVEILDLEYNKKCIFTLFFTVKMDFKDAKHAGRTILWTKIWRCEDEDETSAASAYKEVLKPLQ